MKIKEVTKPFTLLEANMSPGFLAKEAAKINATVGIEFEMYVPDVQISEEESFEFVDSVDVVGISDIVNFYGQDESGNFPSRRIDNIRMELKDMYTDKGTEKAIEEFSEEKGREYVESYVRKHSFSEIYDSVVDSLSPEEMELFDDHDSDIIEKVDERTDEIIASRVMDIVTDPSGNEYIADNWTTKFLRNYDEEDWIDEEFGSRSMDDIHRYLRNNSIFYNLVWPKTVSKNEGNDRIGEITSSFSNALTHCMGIEFVGGYHSGDRHSEGNNYWIMEPDGSLSKTNDSADSGIEFVSPPIPLKDMILTMKEVVEWANNFGCYTNSSTGLHMNVSIPNFENIDFVKLVLFLGDDNILSDFGRMGNTFCKSTMNKVRQQIQKEDGDARRVFTYLYQSLGKAAGDIFMMSAGDKYFSVNMHREEGYVEFRAPGGDWLQADMSQLVNTLNRYVVALDIACNKEKYKNEYAKKLYKLIRIPESDDVIEMFSAYAAGIKNGIMKRSDLKAGLARRQFTRQASKGLEGNNIVWEVNLHYDSGQSYSTAYTVAPDMKKAVSRVFAQKGISGGEIENFKAHAKPIAKALIEPNSDTLYIVMSNTTGFRAYVLAAGPSSSKMMVKTAYPELFGNMDNDQLTSTLTSRELAWIPTSIQ